MASLWPDLADNFAERILKIKCKKEDGNKKCEMCGIKSVKEWNYKLIRKRVLLMMIGRVQRERERDSVQMSQKDMGENCYMTC